LPKLRVGIELDPKYCDVVVQRWQSLSNQQAKRKRNLSRIGKGDGTAMRHNDGSGWQEMAGCSSKLNRKQEEAIVALLGQRSMEETARVAGVGARTLYRWAAATLLLCPSNDPSARLILVRSKN
jgi:hypothetical protein